MAHRYDRNILRPKPTEIQLLLVLPVGIKCRVDRHIGEVWGYSLDDNIQFHTPAFEREIVVSPYVVELQDETGNWQPAFQRGT